MTFAAAIVTGFEQLRGTPDNELGAIKLVLEPRHCSHMTS